MLKVYEPSSRSSETVWVLIRGLFSTFSSRGFRLSLINSAHTRCIVKTSGFTRRVWISLVCSILKGAVFKISSRGSHGFRGVHGAPVRKTNHPPSWTTPFHSDGAGWRAFLHFLSRPPWSIFHLLANLSRILRTGDLLGANWYWYPGHLRPVIIKPVGRIFEISDSNPKRRKCGKCGRSLSPQKSKGLRRFHRAKTRKMRKMRKMRTRKRGKCGKCGWLALMWLALGGPHGMRISLPCHTDVIQCYEIMYAPGPSVWELIQAPFVDFRRRSELEWSLTFIRLQKSAVGGSPKPKFARVCNKKWQFCYSLALISCWRSNFGQLLDSTLFSSAFMIPQFKSKCWGLKLAVKTPKTKDGSLNEFVSGARISPWSSGTEKQPKEKALGRISCRSRGGHLGGRAGPKSEGA